MSGGAGVREGGTEARSAVIYGGRRVGRSDQGRVVGVEDRIGAALSHVPPERAGAAAGILTTAQQFGVASGVAVIGAVYYARLGASGATRASSVSAMEVAMAINAAVVLAAAGLTTLLPRRAAARRPAVTQEPAAQEPAEYSAGAPH